MSDDLCGYVVEHLGDPQAVLVVDETGDLNKGELNLPCSWTDDPLRCRAVGVPDEVGFATRPGRWMPGCGGVGARR